MDDDDTFLTVSGIRESGKLYPDWRRIPMYGIVYEQDSDNRFFMMWFIRLVPRLMSIDDAC